MDDVTEIDLVLLDIAKVWNVFEDRTKDFLAEIIVGENNLEEFNEVMIDINEEMKFLVKVNK